MMLAVMMAALMSSLTSIFNSSSTIFTMDVWTRLRNKPTDTELLVVGRSFVIVLVGVSIAWIPIITKFNSSQLFVYIQAISNFLSPQVTAVFLLGVLWERTTEPGAFWGLMIGFALGILRFVLEFGFFIPPCGSSIPDERPTFIKHFVDDVHYLHYGALLFFATGALTIIISLMTEPISKDKLYRLTFWTRNSKQVRNGFDDEPESEPELKKEKAEEEENTNNEPKAEVNCLVKIVYMICGISNDKKVNVEAVEPLKKTREEEAAEAAEFLQEDSSTKLFINILAVVSMTLACFVIGFYA